MCSPAALSAKSSTGTWVSSEIPPRHLMAALTVGRRASSLRVLLRCDRFQMFWIRAVPDCAQVVNIQSIRDFAYELRVGEPMHVDRRAAGAPASHFGVSGRLDEPTPDPAGTQVGPTFRDGAILL